MDRVVNPDIASMCAFFADGMSGLGKRKRDSSNDQLSPSDIIDLCEDIPLFDRLVQMRRLRLNSKRSRFSWLCIAPRRESSTNNVKSPQPQEADIEAPQYIS